MTPREAHLADHREMLVIRKKSIPRYWKDRNKPHYDSYTQSPRIMLRWLIEQAQFHKHMIEQLESLPDIDFFLSRI